MVGPSRNSRPYLETQVETQESGRTSNLVLSVVFLTQSPGSPGDRSTTDVRNRLYFGVVSTSDILEVSALILKSHSVFVSPKRPQ